MDIILHLGAHKTASTYLQKRLSRSHGRLKRHQISFHGPKSLRPQINKALCNQRGLSMAEAGHRRQTCLAELIYTEEAAGTKRLVLSEEQFLGSLREMVLGRDFYQDAPGRLDPIAKALGDRPVHLLLSVRGYANFLSSVYGQVIRGWRFMPFDQKLRDHFLNQTQGWPELVELILGTFPSAHKITLWPFEDFAGVEHQILTHMAGPAVAELKSVPNRPFSAPSQTTIDWLHAQAAAGKPPDQDTVNAAYETALKEHGHKPFDPWSVEERAYLDSRYRQDLIWLCRLTECTWLTADTEQAA